MSNQDHYDISMAISAMYLSNKLPGLLKYAKQHGITLPSRAVRPKLVVDANAIISDVIWLACKRKNPEGRTNLQEASAAGVVELYSPTYVVQEVERHLVRIAEERGLKARNFFTMLETYIRETGIRFVHVEPVSIRPEWALKDSDDAPYLAAHELLGTDAVLSEDRHIRNAKVPSLRPWNARVLRDYGRQRAVEIGLYAAGINGAAICLLGLKDLITGFAHLASAGKLVRLLLLAGAVAGVAYLLYRMWRDGGQAIKSTALGVHQAYACSRQERSRLEGEITALVPTACGPAGA